MALLEKGEVLDFKLLKKMGMGLDPSQMRVTKSQAVSFESPCKLNNMPILLNCSFKIGAYSYLRGGIIKHLKNIGRYVSIGPNVIIGESEHPTTWLSTSSAFYYGDQFTNTPEERQKGAERAAWHGGTKPNKVAKGSIGNDVWIGANVIIKRGVTIGDGAIVGAGSIVLSDVPPYEVVGGVIAKRLKRRFDDEGLIQALITSKWWEFDANSLNGVPFEDPGAALDEILSREAAGKIERRPPHFSHVILSNDGFEIVKRGR